MSLNIIENSFLKLATDYKLKKQKISPKFNRMSLGNKGVGRLSLQRLGSFVKITFYKNGKYSEIKGRVTNIDYIKKKIQINKEYNINICDIVSILI